MKRNIHFIMTSLAWTVALFLPDSPVRAGLKEGVAAFEAGNLPEAYKEFRAAAEKGESDSQYNLALMYERGIGVAKDLKEALVWYRKSAEQGNSNAQFNLGVMYENGHGCEVDFAQSHLWYRKASLQGDPLAVGNLGMLYLRGQGVKEDKIAAVALLMKSAIMDGSPGNFARQNIAKTKGLTHEIAAAAEKLVIEMSKAKDLLAPLDEYLKTAAQKTAEK